MVTIAVIPARFDSKRLPGKPLEEICGKTMVERVYARAAESRLVDRVLVATDDVRILDTVAGFGGEAVLTSRAHRSGSDRIAEAVDALDADRVVNVQGDEPLIDPEAIDEAVRLAQTTPDAITSLMSPIASRKTLLDPNVVKVVTDRRGFALYFSRSPVPSPPELTNAGPPETDALPADLYFKHIGLYVYPKPLLKALTSLPPSPLERAERLEQLRALDNGIPVRVGTTRYDSVAVDTPADLARVCRIVREQSTRDTVDPKT